jgi:hypothetical protein
MEKKRTPSFQTSVKVVRSLQTDKRSHPPPKVPKLTHDNKTNRKREKESCVLQKKTFNHIGSP